MPTPIERIARFRRDNNIPLGPSYGYTAYDSLSNEEFKQRWAALHIGDPTNNGLSGSGDAAEIDRSIFEPLKTFGVGALNTLSVPQAVVFTLGSKAIEGITGREGMDWSDMKGGFSDDYEGFKEILEQSGVPEDSGWAKWAGLVGDVALDPLWALAPVAKLAKTGSNVAKTVSKMDDPLAGAPKGAKTDILTSVPNAPKTVAKPKKMAEAFAGLRKMGISSSDAVSGDLARLDALNPLAALPKGVAPVLDEVETAADIKKLAKAFAKTSDEQGLAVGGNKKKASNAAREPGLELFSRFIKSDRKLTNAERKLLNNDNRSPAAVANNFPRVPTRTDALIDKGLQGAKGAERARSNMQRKMLEKFFAGSAATSKAAKTVDEVVDAADEVVAFARNEADNVVDSTFKKYDVPGPEYPDPEIGSVARRADKDQMARGVQSREVEVPMDSTGAVRPKDELAARENNRDTLLQARSREDYAYGVRLGWRPTRAINDLSEEAAKKKVRTGQGKVEIQLSKSMVRRLDKVGKVGRATRWINMLPVEWIAKQIESQGKESMYAITMAAEKNKEVLRMKIRERFPNLDDAGVEEHLKTTMKAMTVLAGVRNAALSRDGVRAADDLQRALRDSGFLDDTSLGVLDATQARYLQQLDLMSPDEGLRLIEGHPARGGYMPRKLDDESMDLMVDRNEKMARLEGASPAKNMPRSKSGDLESRSLGSIYSYFTEAEFEDLLRSLVKEDAVDGLMSQFNKNINDAGSSRWLSEKASTNRKLSAEELKKFDKPADAAKAQALRYFGFAEEAARQEIPDALSRASKEFVLDMDFFATALRKEQQYQNRLTDNLIEEMYVKAGVLEYAPHPVSGERILRNVDQDPNAFDFKHKSLDKLKGYRDRSPEDYSDLGSKALKIGRGLKLFFTQPWPGHYWNNMLGDFFNSMVSLGFYQAGKNTVKSGLMRKYDSLSQLAMEGRRVGGKVDLRAFYHTKKVNGKTVIDTSKGRDGKKMYTVAGRDYAGDELLALAHMAGIGRGFTGEIGVNMGAEIGATSKIFEAASFSNKKDGYGLRKYYNVMARNNINREDAMRFRTWVSHMERNGGDPMQAALSTIDGVFDYGRLTNFEKLWMRNIIMFYTWMRLNTPYQVRSMIKNPALYSAYGDIERAREKSPFEPGYVSEMGLIPIPGYGNISIGAPWADLNKIPVPMLPNKDEGFFEKLSSDYLSSVNPIFKVPTELALNKNVFTGTPIEKYPGYFAKPKTPFIGQLAVAIGLGDMARMKKDGEMVPAIDSRFAYGIDSITGPLTVFNRFDAPDDDSYGGWADWITHFAGLGKRVKEKDSWEVGAEQAEAREKANETRRRNATATSPNYSGG